MADHVVIDQTPPEEVETPSEQEPKDRTSEQFDKLKEHNSELKEETEVLQEEVKTYKNLLESLKPEGYTAPSPTPIPVPTPEKYDNLSQEEIDNVVNDMIDPNGYLDGSKLAQRLAKDDADKKGLRERLKRIEEHVTRREAAEEEVKKTDKMKQVHDKYPTLDPSSGEKIDDRFYDLVRNELIGQFMKGKEEPMEAADKVYKLLYGDDMNKKQKEDLVKKDDAKRTINATRPRSNSMAGYYKDAQDDALVDKVRQGKKGALAELLKRRGQ